MKWDEWKGKNLVNEMTNIMINDWSMAGCPRELERYKYDFFSRFQFWFGSQIEMVAIFFLSFFLPFFLSISPIHKYVSSRIEIYTYHQSVFFYFSSLYLSYYSFSIALLKFSANGCVLFSHALSLNKIHEDPTIIWIVEFLQ